MAVVDAADAEIWVDYHQFYVMDPGRPTDFASRAYPGADGLVGATVDAAMIITGISCGRVRVRCEAYRSHPEEDGSKGWEEVGEAQYESSTGLARVQDWDGRRPAELPTLSSAGPGRYVLRVYATGRGLNPDGVSTDDPAEHYLLRMWPSQ